MAGRAKVKEVLSPELLEFFDDLTGTGAVSLEIVIPKAKEMRKIGLTFISLLTELAEVLTAISLIEYGSAVQTLTENFLTNFDAYFCAPIDLTLEEIKDATKEFRTKYGILYRKMKHSRVITTLLKISHALSWIPNEGPCQTQPSLAKIWKSADEDRIRSVLLLTATDIGVDIDFSKIYTRNAEDAHLMWPTVFKLFKLGDQMFTILNKPDFDPEILCTAVTESITRFSKQIRGAEAGFKLIRESTEMFRENAGRYQERIEATGNGLEIYTCYFQDLQTKADKMDRHTKLAFLRIVRHVQTMSQHMTSNAPNGKGSRLLKSLTASVGAAAEQATADMEDTPDTAHLMAELRKTREEDEERALAHGEETRKLLTKSATKIFPAKDTDENGGGGSADDVGSAGSPGSPSNIDEVVAWINGGKKPKR